MYFFEDEIAKMAEQLGMRAILSRCIIGEGEDMIKKAEEAETLYNNYHNKCEGRIKVCVGLHAPNTCPPETIRKGIELADKLATPILYTVDMFHGWILWIFRINPMTHLINAYRDIFYVHQVPRLGTLSILFVICIVFLIISYKVFKKMEKGFAEEL